MITRKQRKKLSNIKVRFTSILLIVLVFIPILITIFTFLSNPIQAAWFDSNYSFRQRVDITNGSGGNLTDYQIKIFLNSSSLISAGKLQSDCDDIKITDHLGKTLPHWIESGSNTCNTTTTAIWTKVPFIPTSNGVVYLYYGNANASNSQNGTNVFPVFGDFATGSSLPSSWIKTDVGTSGTASVGSGVLTITNTNGADVYNSDYGATQVYNNATVNGNFIAETQVYSQTNDDPWSKTGIAVQNSVAAATSNGHALLATTPGNGVIFQHQADGTTVAPNTNSSGGSYSFPTFLRVVKSGSGIGGYFSANGSSWTQQGSTVTPTGMSTNQYVSLFITPHNTSATGTATYKYFFVRQYVATEPTNSLGSEEVGPGPIAYWKMDEGRGQTTGNSSSISYSGTLGANVTPATDDPTWRSDDMCVSGKCLNFDGSNDYLLTTPINVLTTNFTFSGWVKSNVVSTWQTIFQSGTATNFWRINIDNSNRLDFTKDSIADYASTSTLVRDRWNHIAIVKSGDSGTNLTFYINGRQAGTASVGSVVTPSGSSYISAPSAGVNGSLDEIKLYPYARTAAQVLSDFNLNAERLGIVNQRTLSNGLAGYWKMDEASWTINCSTNSVLDSSGNGNNGRSCPNSTGPAGGALGKFGNSGSFDGSNDYVLVPNSTSLAFTDLTVSTWVNPVANNVSVGIVSKRNSFGTMDWELFHNASGRPSFLVGESSAVNVFGANSPPALALNTWTHIAVTKRGNEYKIFINGVVYDTQFSSQTWVDSDPIVLGAAAPGSMSFNGRMDETRVYNRGLSSEEITMLYNFAPEPVLNWKMDETTWTNDCSTATVLDSSVNQNNGKSCPNSTGPTTPTLGKTGRAGDFDGTDDYVEGPANTSVSMTGALSISAWVKFDTVNSNYRTIAGRWHVDVDQHYLIQLNTDNKFYFFFDYNGGNASSGQLAAASTTVASAGVWYHVEGVFDPLTTSLRIYINGILEGTTTNASLTSGVAGTVEFTSGSKKNSSGTYFEFLDGVIDEVKLYNYARNESQIIEDLNSDPLPSVAGASLPTPLAYYRMDEQSGQTVNNLGLGGSSLNGTLGSSSSVSTDDPTWKTKSDCKINGCMDFDGSEDYVSVADNDKIDFGANQNLTLSLWFKTPDPSTVSTLPFIFGKGANTNGTPGYGITIGGTTQKGRVAGIIGDGTTRISATTTNSFHDNTWHNVTAVFKRSSNIEIYIDGVLSATANISSMASASIANSNSLEIGRRFANNYTGLIDEVKIFNTDLTIEQIRQNYNSSGYSLDFGSQAPAEATLLTGGAGNPPVAYYNLDQNTGDITIDMSGNNHHGNIYNSAQWAPGKIGAGLTMNDPSDQYVEIDSVASSLASGDITFSTWFKPTSTINSSLAQDSHLFTLSDESSTNDFRLYFASSVGALRLRVNSQNADTSITSWSAGVWYHVTAIFSTTTGMKVYINGNLVGSNANTTRNSAIPSAYATLGGQYFGLAFNGVMDESKIYTYERNQAQIMYDYNRGGPIGWWKFNECQGATANDSSGFGNSGTITIGGSGTQTSIGTCTTSGSAWANGSVGKFNSSLNFDGTDDYINMGDPASGYLDIGANQDFTVSAWVKTTNNSAIGANQGRILSKRASPNGYELYVEVGSDRPGLYLSDGVITSTHTATAGTQVVTDSNWHFIAAQRVGSTVRLYVDGNQVFSGNTGATGSLANATSLYIGNAPAFSRHWPGQIDDIRLYNYALSQAQIRQVYNGGAVRFGPVTGSP